MAKAIKRMTVSGRLMHWANALCVLTSVITGLYIASPYYATLQTEPAAYKYVMAYNRLFHFLSAVLLDVTSVVITYLYFFSRHDKVYKRLIPNKKNIVEFFEVLLNLVTLNRRKKFDSSHEDSFNIVYFTVFHLLLVYMLFTGFQLYVVGLESGISSIGRWWPFILHLVTDWTLYVHGGLMGVRKIHHILMYWIIAWVFIHIYYEVWRTIFWKEGDIVIPFGGYKFKK